MYVDIIKDKTGRLDIQKYCTIVFQLETATLCPAVWQWRIGQGRG